MVYLVVPKTFNRMMSINIVTRTRLKSACRDSWVHRAEWSQQGVGPVTGNPRDG